LDRNRENKPSRRIGRLGLIWGFPAGGKTRPRGRGHKGAARSNGLQQNAAVLEGCQDCRFAPPLPKARIFTNIFRKELRPFVNLFALERTRSDTFGPAARLKEPRAVVKGKYKPGLKVLGKTRMSGGPSLSGQMYSSEAAGSRKFQGSGGEPLKVIEGLLQVDPWE